MFGQSADVCLFKQWLHSEMFQPWFKHVKKGVEVETCVSALVPTPGVPHIPHVFKPVFKHNFLGAEAQGQG